jgi:glycosyltransferase involved in cell wall biosynthesis
MPAGTPDISVVVVTRDRPALLADALAGIAAQRHAPIEVTVADDGDTACNPADFPPAAPRVRALRSHARQAAASRNLAAAACRGEVIAFLDDDDRWSAGHLEGLAAAFADPAVAVAYRDTAVILERIEGGERVELDRRVIARDWDAALMRHDDFVAPSALAVRRTLFERLGGFDTSLRYSEDWDFLLRAAALSVPRRVIGITVEIRLRESGNASLDRGSERRECLDRLSRRHRLPPLEIKTFWEVAAVAAGAAR